MQVKGIFPGQWYHITTTGAIAPSTRKISMVPNEYECPAYDGPGKVIDVILVESAGGEVPNTNEIRIRGKYGVLYTQPGLGSVFFVTPKCVRRHIVAPEAKVNPETHLVQPTATDWPRLIAEARTKSRELYAKAELLMDQAKALEVTSDQMEKTAALFMKDS